MKGKWIVDVKGGIDGHFEVSILREDNEHGIISYGWPHWDQKIILASRDSWSDNATRTKDQKAFIKQMLDVIVEQAQVMADQKNGE